MSLKWISTATLMAVLLMEGQAEAIRTLKLPLLDGMTCDVSLYTGFQTVIYLPEPAVHVNAGDTEKFQIRVENRGSRYLVQPIGSPPSTNFNLRTASASTISLHLSLTSSADKAVTMIRFTDPGEWDNPRAALQKLCGQPEEPEQLDLDLALMTARRNEIGFAPGFSAHFKGGGHELILTTGALSRSASRLSARFTLENAGARDYPVEGLSIRDGRTDFQYLRCLRASVARDQSAKPSVAVVCTDAGKLRLVLRPGERIEGEFTAERPEQLLESFIVQIHTRPGVHPAAFGWTDEPRSVSTPPRNLHKITAGLVGIGGAIRLGGDDGDWASTQIVGVRTSYTAQRWLSVGASLEALRAGSVDLEQDSATISGGRFQAQILVHFGDRVVPYFHAGVGVFAGSQSSTTAPSAFRFGGLWGFGIGADVWISERLVAGVAGSYLDGELLSAELGLHIGYAWKR